MYFFFLVEGFKKTKKNVGIDFFFCFFFGNIFILWRFLWISLGAAFLIFFYFVTTMFGNQKKITRSKHPCVVCVVCRNSVCLGRAVVIIVTCCSCCLSGVNIAPFFLWNRHVGAPNGSFAGSPAGPGPLCFIHWLCLHFFFLWTWFFFSSFLFCFLVGGGVASSAGTRFSSGVALFREGQHGAQSVKKWFSNF